MTEIVFNENEWAANALRELSLGRKPAQTLQRLARYYLDCGYSDTETAERLNIFIIRSSPTASLVLWRETVDGVLRAAKKHKAINIGYIDITEKELLTVEQQSGAQLKRLAFTLLCYAKYWNKVADTNSCWINADTADIMTSANIKAPLRRQEALLHSLRDNGLVSFSKRVDNTNVKVLFTDDGESVIRIDDFRNLGYRYESIYSSRFFVCKDCGLVCRLTNIGVGRNKIYCDECAKKRITAQKISWKKSSKDRQN